VTFDLENLFINSHDYCGFHLNPSTMYEDIRSHKIRGNGQQTDGTPTNTMPLAAYCWEQRQTYLAVSTATLQNIIKYTFYTVIFLFRHKIMTILACPYQLQQQSEQFHMYKVMFAVRVHTDKLMLIFWQSTAKIRNSKYQYANAKFSYFMSC